MSEKQIFGSCDKSNKPKFLNLQDRNYSNVQKNGSFRDIKNINEFLVQKIVKEKLKEYGIATNTFADKAKKCVLSFKSIGNSSKSIKFVLYLKKNTLKIKLQKVFKQATCFSLALTTAQ